MPLIPTTARFAPASSALRRDGDFSTADATKPAVECNNPASVNAAPGIHYRQNEVCAVKLHQSTIAGLNIFTAYGEGFVTVNQEKYEKSLIVTPDEIIPEWTAATPTELGESEMQRLRQLGVEVVLLGTGKALRFPPAPLLRPFAPAGIGLEVMNLQAACRTYNILAAEGRKVAAALVFD